jgi:hypothetical protein
MDVVRLVLLIDNEVCNGGATERHFEDEGRSRRVVVGTTGAGVG